MRAVMTRGKFLGAVAAGSTGVAGLAMLATGGGGTTPATAAASHQPAAVHQQAGRIDVTLTPWLAQNTTSRKRRLHVAFRPGITPAEIALTEGFQESDLMSIMPVVNGRQVALTSPLAAGDRLELITGMAGG